MKQLLAAALALVGNLALAAEPLPVESFAQAIRISPVAEYPVQQLLLPDAVYGWVVSPVLNDVRVFDASGKPVPHVFCPVPQQRRYVESQQPLPVFPVRLAQPGAAPLRAELSTGGGERIAITVPGSGQGVAVSAYDLDLRAIKLDAVALQLQWHSPSGLSEVHIEVAQSHDGQQWQPVVADGVLKRIISAGQQMQSDVIALPPARYQYLRLTPSDPASVVIDAVILRSRELHSEPLELRWFSAASTGPADEPAVAASGRAAAPGQGYDALHRAPVTLARLRLHELNSRAALRLQSRHDAQAAWQTQWTGEAFFLQSPTGDHRNEDIALPLNTDRYWRLLAEPGGAPFTADLQLGYAPQNLRFMAQGEGPYQLAYGNAQAAARATAGSCEELLKTLLRSAKLNNGESHDDIDLFGNAEAGTPQMLAGLVALQALPVDAPLPWRRWLLWAVLAAAVLLLLVMARGLLGDLKTPPP